MGLGLNQLFLYKLLSAGSYTLVVGRGFFFYSYPETLYRAFRVFSVQEPADNNIEELAKYHRGTLYRVEYKNQQIIFTRRFAQFRKRF